MHIKQVFWFLKKHFFSPKTIVSLFLTRRGTYYLLILMCWNVGTNILPSIQPKKVPIIKSTQDLVVYWKGTLNTLTMPHQKHLPPTSDLINPKTLLEGTLPRVFCPPLFAEVSQKRNAHSFRVGVPCFETPDFFVFHKALGFGFYRNRTHTQLSVMWGPYTDKSPQPRVLPYTN